jgi:hypothetical protein
MNSNDTAIADDSSYHVWVQGWPCWIPRATPKLCHDRPSARMRTQTRLLVVASLCGAIVGALAALRISRPVRIGSSRGERRNLATTETAQSSPIHLATPASEAAQPSAPVVNGQPSATVATAEGSPERAFSLVAWRAAEDLSKSEQLCTVGEPIACLALAEFEDQRSRLPKNFAKSRAYKERAYSILVPQCHRRDPDACVVIARMHALGFGLAKDPANQAALIGRAREICKRRSAAVCSAFGP